MRNKITNMQEAKNKKRKDNFVKSFRENIDALSAGYTLVPDQETGILSAGKGWEKKKAAEKNKKNAAIEKTFWNRKKL